MLYKDVIDIYVDSCAEYTSVAHDSGKGMKTQEQKIQMAPRFHMILCMFCGSKALHKGPFELTDRVGSNGICVHTKQGYGNKCSSVSQSQDRIPKLQSSMMLNRVFLVEINI